MYAEGRRRGRRSRAASPRRATTAGARRCSPGSIRCAPNFWRDGETFPPDVAAMHRLFANDEIDFSMSNNQHDVVNKIRQGVLPPTARAFVLRDGTIANSHYVGIPFNAPNPAGAMVVANLLLSPEAQFEKQRPEVWADGTVLDVASLPEPWRDSIHRGGGRSARDSARHAGALRAARGRAARITSACSPTGRRGRAARARRPAADSRCEPGFAQHRRRRCCSRLLVALPVFFGDRLLGARRARAGGRRCSRGDASTESPAGDPDRPHHVARSWLVALRGRQRAPRLPRPALHCVALLFAATSALDRRARSLATLPLPVPHLVAAATALFVLGQSGLLARVLLRRGRGRARPRRCRRWCTTVPAWRSMLSLAWKELPFLAVVAIALRGGQRAELDRGGAHARGIGRCGGAARDVAAALARALPAVVATFVFAFGSYESAVLLAPVDPAPLPVLTMERFADPALARRGEAYGLALLALVVAAVAVAVHEWTRAAGERSPHDDRASIGADAARVSPARADARGGWRRLLLRARALHLPALRGAAAAVGRRRAGAGPRCCPTAFTLDAWRGVLRGCARARHGHEPAARRGHGAWWPPRSRSRWDARWRRLRGRLRHVAAALVFLPVAAPPIALGAGLQIATLWLGVGGTTARRVAGARRCPPSATPRCCFWACSRHALSARRGGCAHARRYRPGRCGDTCCCRRCARPIAESLAICFLISWAQVALTLVVGGGAVRALPIEVLSLAARRTGARGGRRGAAARGARGGRARRAACGRAPHRCPSGLSARDATMSQRDFHSRADATRPPQARLRRAAQRALATARTPLDTTHVALQVEAPACRSGPGSQREPVDGLHHMTLGIAARRARRAARSLGRREDVAAARDRRPRADHRRPHRDPRTRRDAHGAGAAWRRVPASGAGALPAPLGGRERRLSAHRARGAARPSERARCRPLLERLRLGGLGQSCAGTRSAADSGTAWRSRARSPPRPHVLLLDEPLSALDPVLRRDVREAIRDAARRQRGRTPARHARPRRRHGARRSHRRAARPDDRTGRTGRRALRAPGVAGR